MSRGLYRCAACGGHFKSTEVVVDHVSPVVPVSGWISFDSFVENLFCEVENLQTLCKECHKDKTATEAKLRGMNRKIGNGSLLDIIQIKE